MRLTLHYTLSLHDGTLIDSTDRSEPFIYTVGSGSLLPAVEARVVALPLGEPTTLIFTPEESFGLWDETACYWLPRDDFSELPEVGSLMSFALPESEEIIGRVIALEADRIQVDLNHPLAGEVVVMVVEVVAREEEP